MLRPAGFRDGRPEYPHRHVLRFRRADDCHGGPNGAVTRTYYDSANRPATVVQNLVGQDIYITAPPARTSGTNDQDIRTDTQYDANGRRIAETDPMGHVTRYNYNPQGQLASTVVNPLDGQPENYQNQYNLTTSYTYDALGRQLTSTDPLGRVTASVYDALGRTKTSTQNVKPGQPQNSQNQYNISTAYTYDSGGAQIAVTDPLGMVNRTCCDNALGSRSARYATWSARMWKFPSAGRAGTETNLRTDSSYDGDGPRYRQCERAGENQHLWIRQPGRTKRCQRPAQQCHALDLRCSRPVGELHGCQPCYHQLRI